MFLFDAGHFGLIFGRKGQVWTQMKKFILDRRQALHQSGVQPLRHRQPDHTIQLVHRAIRVDPQGVFWHPFSSTQGGGPIIPFACI